MTTKVPLSAHSENIDGRTRTILSWRTAIALVLAATMLMSISPTTIALENGGSRTGATGNEPVGGFLETGTKVIIYNQTSGIADTTFDIDENITISIESTQVNDNAGGSCSQNRLRTRDHLGNVIYDNTSFFTYNGGPPYLFTGILKADVSKFPIPDDYSIELNLKCDPPSAKAITFLDNVQVGGGNVTAPKYIKLFSDPARTHEQYKYGPNSKIYVEMWTGALPSVFWSEMTLRDYRNNRQVFQIDQLNEPSITMNGSYARFNISMPNDLMGAGVPMTSGNWYSLVFNMMGDQLTALTMSRAVQFELNNSIANTPMVVQGNTKTFPSPIVVGGPVPESTTLYTPFTHDDQPSVNVFNVTIKVKDESGVEYVLAANRRDGQGGVSIVHVTGNQYNASLSWTPPAGQALGYYDLYFNISDGVTSPAEDPYVGNENELLLVAPAGMPVIELGKMWATPDSIEVNGTESTSICFNFTHKDDPAIGTFQVTIKVRDPGNHEVPIATSAANGTQGMTITKVSPMNFTACVVWDPTNEALGTYDLFGQVVDANTLMAEDVFDNNLDKLTLTKAVAKPIMAAGNTTADPVEVIIGEGTTTISATFSHADGPSLNSFKVSVAVRAPDNTVLVLANNATIGEQNMSLFNIGSGVYKASVTWAPVAPVMNGTYDLLFKVEDANGLNATDDFGNNVDELTLKNPPGIPVIPSGSVMADPARITRKGDVKTMICVEFTHPDVPAKGVFTVTLMVKDLGNIPTTLVNAATDGAQGLSVDMLGNATYRACFDWDPSETQALGTYDLYAKVTDPLGHEAVDGFSNNEDELDITDEAVPTPGLAWFNGTVVNGSASPPTAVTGAKVILYVQGDAFPFAEYTTIFDGSFSFNIAKGTYVIKVEAFGYEPFTKENIVVTEGATLDETLSLEPLKTVEGDDDGKEATVPGWVWAIVALLVIVIVLLMLVLLLKMGSSPPTAGGGRRKDDDDRFTTKTSKDHEWKENKVEHEEMERIKKAKKPKGGIEETDRESEPVAISPKDVEVEKIPEDEIKVD